MNDYQEPEDLADKVQPVPRPWIYTLVEGAIGASSRRSDKPRLFPVPIACDERESSWLEHALNTAGIDFDGFQDGRLAFSTEKKLKEAMRAAWIAGYRNDDAWEYLGRHNLTDGLDR